MLSQSLRRGTSLLMSTYCNSHTKTLIPHGVRCLSKTNIYYKRAGPIELEEGHPPKRKNFKESLLPADWQKLIQKYPDFLPDPINNSPFLVMRHVDDMLKRRAVVDIPEFYVGSLLAVTVSDKFAETKRSRFVGICVERTGQLKLATFTLRNIIDGMGCEIRYDLYNPLILNIEVLRLEKRLDESLVYLRDALPEYSTVPEDMKAEALEPNAEVPLNRTLVQMKPRPWTRRWERYLFKGIEKLEDIPQYFADKTKLHYINNPIYTYDMMMDYRSHCTEELMYNIYKRLINYENTIVKARDEARAKVFLRVSKKDPVTAPPPIIAAATST